MFSNPGKKISKALDQAVDRKIEEALFEQVVQELDEGIKKEGLWAKALMLTDGDKDKAYPKYIALRAQAIQDDALINTVDAVKAAAIAAEKSEKVIPPVEPTVDISGTETVVQPSDFEQWGFIVERVDQDSNWRVTHRVVSSSFLLNTHDLLRLQTSLRKGIEKYGWDITYSSNCWRLKTFLPKTEVTVSSTAEFLVKIEEKIAAKEGDSGY